MKWPKYTVLVLEWVIKDIKYLKKAILGRQNHFLIQVDGYNELNTNEYG